MWRLACFLRHFLPCPVPCALGGCIDLYRLATHGEHHRLVGEPRRQAVDHLIARLNQCKDGCRKRAKATVGDRDVFGLETDKLQQPARSRSVSQPRMLAMWLARKHTAAGLHEISQFFGRRSHSSAVTAHHTVDNWIASGAQLDINGQACDVRDIVSQIESLLRAS